MLLNKLTDCLVAYSCFVLCTELGECHCATATLSRADATDEDMEPGGNRTIFKM